MIFLDNLSALYFYLLKRIKNCMQICDLSGKISMIFSIYKLGTYLNY